MGDEADAPVAPPGTVDGVSPAATPSTTTTATAAPMGALDPALYVPQDLRQPPRRDPYEVDEAINIIEEGEHVSAEDFGLSSTEISMSAAIAMNVGMELNTMQQIDAFLAARPSAELTTSAPAQQRDPSNENRTAKHELPTTTRLESATTRSVVAVAGNSCGTGLSPAVPTVAVPSAAPYPTRRDDKVLQLESHPLVASLASDGRHVVCKCGKSVRLNPPWYIIKYEQHIVSRNCTFLRKKQSQRDHEAKEKTLRARADSSSKESTASSSQPEQARDDESRGDGTGSDTAGSSSVDGTQSAHGDQDYRLETTEDLLSRYSQTKQRGDEPDVGHDLIAKDSGEKKKIMATLDTLKAHSHFSRITPDGKFLECKCSELIILAIPWGLREFYAHVDSKSKPQAPPRRKSSSAMSKKPRVGDGATHRVEQRLIVRDTRWKPVSKRTELPCPGLRGERISVYISSTTRTTGGSRARRRIAGELFPHRFASAEIKDGKKVLPKLTRDEKQMLRDAVECESLWFMDHDANALRSLDCRGSISANKDQTCCASCAALRLNASLRISVTVAMGYKQIPDDVAAPSDTPATPTTRKASTATFALLEQEFDMAEEYARLLRDLFRADVEETSVKNMWFEMAELGISGLFAAHPAFLGLVESMMVRKDKERRGVGLQNMLYSDHLDSFMKSLSDISPHACDFFQQQLGGRKQKYLVAMKKRRVDAGKEPDGGALDDVDLGAGIAESASASASASTAVSTTATDSFDHLSFDLTSSSAIHSLTGMQEVDLTAFHADQPPSVSLPSGAEAEPDETDAFLTDENMDIPQEDIEGGTVCKVPTAVVSSAATIITPGYAPCQGLRDPKVQAYVVNAVQITGGSRPKYVIAKELFPEVFDGSRKIKIMKMLSDHERGILLDAMFSECLWRVDRSSHCVRSLRCLRRVDKKRGNGVCRACLDLKSIANFRSVLCRAKVPKKVENLKYVPSVYTESDPFMRKLSKNASLRTLYQTVKRVAADEKKKVTFWLRLAKMGLFGHFRSHVVFEGLIASMVELKDRERRGVGKQNMLYAKSLDVFMAELSALSMDAFELFAHHFCGRSTRSQKVKKRKALTQLYDSAIQQAMVANSLAMACASNVDMAEGVSQAPSATTMTTGTVSDPHALMISEDLLGPARPISSVELEENQRFMDHMLDEVRLSVTAHDDHEPDDGHLDPQTYLDENGVLTTVL